MHSRICAFPHFHSVDLRSSEHPRRMLVSNSCNLTSRHFASYWFPFFFSSSSTQFQYYPIVSTKLHFRTGRDVPREGTALFDVPLHVCPGCCASGSLRAAAFGCDGADLGPKVPGYQRHRKRWVFEILWIKEPARHVPVAEKVAEKVFL